MTETDFPRWPDGELGKALAKILSANSIKYRLRTILVDKDKGFLYNNVWYETEAAAKKAVDDAYASIELSIVKADGTETKLSEEYKRGYSTGRSPYTMYKNNEDQNETNL